MISAHIRHATALQHQVTIAASNAATQRLRKQIVNVVTGIVAKSARPVKTSIQKREIRGRSK